MAVADSAGRVFSVLNIRVADISAFPLLPPGHPQATVCKCSRLRPVYVLVCFWMRWVAHFGPVTALDMLAEKIAVKILG